LAPENDIVDSRAACARTKWCCRSLASMPTAVKTPGEMGTSTRRISSARATSTACTGPLPPKATSV
jgi:hypothetical protein